MKMILAILVSIFMMPLAVAQSGPSLQETFDWMTSTLRPSEGNNWFIHHPTPRPHPKEWVDKSIDPYHQESILEFSRNFCDVKLVVDVINNDMGNLIGLRLNERDIDTFNLKDIDPNTIKVTNSCEPIETPLGNRTPWNCEDEAGLQMEFKTRNAQPLIHHEVMASSSPSLNGMMNPKKDIDGVCKAQPTYPFCPTAMKSNVWPAANITSDNMVFHSPTYTKRFIKAFRHAVELCGGKASTF